MLEKSNKKREGFRKAVKGKVAVFFVAFPQKEAVGLKKDLYLKRYLSDKRRFADLINGFVSEGREVLTADKLTEMGSQSESTRTQKYRDQDRLKPCITLVLYFGEQWSGATHLHELLDFTDIPSELRELVNDYRIHVLQVQRLTDTSVFHTDLKQVFDAIRFSKDPARFRKLILSDPAYRSLDVEAYNVIVQYTHANDLLALRENYHKGEKIDMCQALTIMLNEEKSDGIREGKDIGIREGKASSILILLSEHAEIPESLSERIRSEQDISVLTDWLKLAAKAPTLDDFTKNM